MRINWQKTKVIRSRLGLKLAVAYRKKEWRERIEEMSQERLVRRVFEGDVSGRRPRGWPRKRWNDVSHTYIVKY